jgi:outer membrane protein assembly factor BamB
MLLLVLPSLATLVFAGTLPPGLYGVEIVVEGNPPAEPVQLAIAKLDDTKHKMVDTVPPFPSGAIGQATGSIDSKAKILYMLDGLYDGKSLSYRIAARDLGTGSLLGIYPVDIPFVHWTGFGQQMGVDTSLNAAVVLAPSNSSEVVPPFHFGIWAIDLTKNTSKLLTSLPDPPGITPIFEGFPADVCSKTHTFYFITGVGDVRNLVAVDIVTGKIKFEKKLDAPPSLTLIGVDSRTGKLWGGGYSDHELGTMALLELDPTTGDVLSNTPASTLGTGWTMNILPGVVAVDSAAGALVFPARKFPPGNPNFVSLIRLPFPSSNDAPSATENFCTLDAPSKKSNFTCPKLLRYYDA